MEFLFSSLQKLQKNSEYLYKFHKYSSNVNIMQCLFSLYRHAGSHTHTKDSHQVSLIHLKISYRYHDIWS